MSGKARPKNPALSAQIGAVKWPPPQIRAGDNVRSRGSYLVTGVANSSCNAIFISDLRPEHEPNSFFIAKRNLIGFDEIDQPECEVEAHNILTSNPCATKPKAVFPMYLNPCEVVSRFDRRPRTKTGTRETFHKHESFLTCYLLDHLRAHG